MSLGPQKKGRPRAATATATATAIKIQLEAQRRTYFNPGDTICGTIDRSARTVAPRARVVITLHGRSRAEIDVEGKQHSFSDHNPSFTDNYYRDEVSFFPAGTATQVVFDGPLHIEEGGDPAAWPFAVTIPLRIDKAMPWARRANGTHVALSEEERRLPPTFSFSDTAGRTDMSADVDYHLEARMRPYFSAYPSKGPDAILPIYIRPALHPGPPISDARLRPQITGKHYKFLSHRLIPGQEDAKLSSSQKMKRFFHSSQVPCLVVRYRTEAPVVVQLGNPMPIPLLIRAEPVWDESSDAIQDVPQRIRLDHVSLNIIADTTVWADGLDEHQTTNSRKTHLGGYRREDRTKEADGMEVYLPFSTKDPPLDVGPLLSLRVGYAQRIEKRPAFMLAPSRVSPPFRTPNILHRGHRLHWCIRVSAAGESHEISGTQPVRVLSPSDGNEVPPPLLGTQESWAKPLPEKEKEEKEKEEKEGEEKEAPPPYCPAKGGQEGEGSMRAI
ncbi:hypothetical protein IMZ48_04145 [Candidatus Bathyarchaeota archaeon]|nr:hypothetical protein [Candidatus Bathyarchaeota archaeon]